MSDFKIQETIKIHSCGSRCTRCREIIERKEGVYRVKYGSELFHLNCFYTWLKHSIPRIEDRNVALKGYYEDLKGYMPQILAESLTSGK